MPSSGIEPPTFALQERRTTTVLRGLGALLYCLPTVAIPIMRGQITADGNRTHVFRLEGEHSTTELQQSVHMHTICRDILEDI